MASNYMTAQDRRIATLAGHFRGAAAGEEGFLQAFPTMANSPSVFEHVQQAPEDPILGVRLVLFIFSCFVSLMSA